MSKAAGKARSKSTAPELVQVDARSYLAHLDEGHTQTIQSQLEAHNISPDDLTIFRIELKSRLDKSAWKAAIAQFPQGQVIDIIANRISGAEMQKQLGHSLPGQVRAGVLAALLDGARCLLVVVETASAKPRSPRPVFNALVQLVEEGRVRVWWAASLDRVTRWPIDGCRLVEALQDTRTFLKVGNSTTYDAVDPIKGLMLIIQFAMNSMQVIMISAGLRRVWRERLGLRQWLRDHRLLGMDLDKDAKPSYSLESRAVLLRIFELVAQGNTPKLVAEMITNEFPEWVAAREAVESRRGSRVVSAARILTAIETSVLTDGKQIWGFREESIEVAYPQLAGIVPESLRIRARNTLLARPSRTYDRTSPWLQMLTKFLEVHQHPIETVVALAHGALGWSDEGNLTVTCTTCSTGEDDDAQPNGYQMVEISPDQETIRLIDDTVREKVKIPRFECRSCESRSTLFSKKMLSWLLAGCRPPRCPLCPNPWVDVKRGPGGIGYIGSCEPCEYEFPIPGERLPLSSRVPVVTSTKAWRHRKRPSANQRELDDYSGTSEDSQ